MKVLILPDSFKNCLTSIEVGKALAAGILRVYPEAEVKNYPVADGGEGTVEAFVAATNGEVVKCKAHDSLGREIESFYGKLPNGAVVIEMAAASGIEIILPEERNPVTASTFGTGELILAAIKGGAKHIILGLGGSATNDGGTGMAKALGYRFLDPLGNELPEGGGALDKLDKIDISQVYPPIKNVVFSIACDVQNPLTGPNGASVFYGPQKGATPEMAEQLDKNLLHLSKIMAQDLGIDVNEMPGAGAAGGMGAGAVAFLNGKLTPGFDIVKKELHLEEKIKNSDIILTGEGKMDKQTLQGKAPFAVAQLAKKYDKPVLAFAGTLGEGYRELYNYGFDSIFSIVEKPMTLEQSLSKAGELLADAAERVFRLIKLVRFPVINTLFR